MPFGKLPLICLEKLILNLTTSTSAISSPQEGKPAPEQVKIGSIQADKEIHLFVAISEKLRLKKLKSQTKCQNLITASNWRIRMSHEMRLRLPTDFQ